MGLLQTCKDVLRAPSAVRSISRRLAELHDRVEFLRSEILYEMKYGVAESRPAETVEPRIVDPAKVAAQAASGLRLNLGCGHVPLDGYINVDMRAVEGVDVVSTIDQLPFGPGTVSEIRSSHVLEHFPQEMLRRALLPHWFSRLRPGGLFAAVVPDGQAMVTRAAAGDYSFADFREVLFGSQDYAGDFHYNMFTPASLADLLAEAGFVEIGAPVVGRANGRCYEFEITARKPLDAAAPSA